MRCILLISVFLCVILNAYGQTHCLFHFKSTQREYMQQASVELIRDYVVQRGFDSKYFIAWSENADRDNIFVLIDVQKMEDILMDESMKSIHKSGIRNTAEWFLSLTLNMPYRFNPNLSLSLHSMKYLDEIVDVPPP